MLDFSVAWSSQTHAIGVHLWMCRNLANHLQMKILLDHQHQYKHEILRLHFGMWALVVFAKKRVPFFSTEVFKSKAVRFASPYNLGDPYNCAIVLFRLTPHSNKECGLLVLGSCVRRKVFFFLSRQFFLCLSGKNCFSFHGLLRVHYLLHLIQKSN